ncbi:hypothetical protein Syun_003766 [Stephania yunnanensis]|uniref:Uncharacterized protein n=1 Tax=Stephania yunnanensis TaxID=152371 RepID=A0AAP0Q1X4_9MAGN
MKIGHMFEINYMNYTIEHINYFTNVLMKTCIWAYKLGSSVIKDSNSSKSKVQQVAFLLSIPGSRQAMRALHPIIGLSIASN